jgi:hypothetical protein
MPSADAKPAFPPDVERAIDEAYRDMRRLLADLAELDQKRVLLAASARDILDVAGAFEDHDSVAGDASRGVLKTRLRIQEIAEGLRTANIHRVPIFNVISCDDLVECQPMYEGFEAISVARKTLDGVTIADAVEGLRKCVVEMRGRPARDQKVIEVFLAKMTVRQYH